MKAAASSERFGHLVDDAGRWRTRDDVRIWYGDRTGALTVGYGADRDRIGPELGLGWVMGDALDAPVLLIKCAWGGKSLAVDFRPPSAGRPAYSLGAKEDAEVARDPTIVGRYYREIVSQTKAALADIKTLVPGSDGTYVLSGFGWHQGWNDRINDRFNAEYESNLTHFIRDVRRDLGAPGLPFVIAETGMNGPGETHPRALSLMKAQAAVAGREEFRGSVAFVGTRSFWRPKEESPTGQGYHWNTNAETYYLIGEAMGEAMKRLVRVGGGPPRAGEMAGYLIVPIKRVPESFNAGFSMYVAWPLLKTYPGDRFQSGLFGTWMFARHEGRAPEKLYSDIEGGLGWWRDTRFATETPKFSVRPVNRTECYTDPTPEASGILASRRLSSRTSIPKRDATFEASVRKSYTPADRPGCGEGGMLVRHLAPCCGSWRFPRSRSATIPNRADFGAGLVIGHDRTGRRGTTGHRGARVSAVTPPRCLRGRTRGRPCDSEPRAGPAAASPCGPGRWTSPSRRCCRPA